SEAAFSTPLYEIAAVALNTTMQEVKQRKQQGDKPIRALLEDFGDLLLATLGNNCLIIRMAETLRELKDSQDTPELAVITDLRTEDEAYWVRAMKGLVIHVSRPEGTSDSEHSTNQPITFAQGDQYLLNNGTVEDLGITACSIVRAWIIANRLSVAPEHQEGA
ncbi:MAG: hypothetical protein KAG70_10305, partial [Alcanivorax sp.]|nr:hypothetical protein [Alcanivorax sp.]